MTPTVTDYWGFFMAICDDLFSVDDLATELDVTRRTIERWHAQRIGPPRIKIGKRVYYRGAAVREWILSQEQEQPRAPRGRAA